MLCVRPLQAVGVLLLLMMLCTPTTLIRYIYMFNLHPFLVTAKARKTKELIPSSVRHVTTPGSARAQKDMENQDIWRLFSYITPGIHTLPDQASCLWKQTFIHFPRTLQKCLSTISVWLRV